ncbi:MAG: radical SAM family heme chaperone HemW, partial [Arenimonas sp.]
GIGAGAHGKISSGASGDILRRWKVKNPRDYLQHANTEKRIGGDELITPENRPFDYMLNALRLSEGFSMKDFEVRTGLDRSAIDKKLSHAKLMGWLSEKHGHVVPTELGQRFSNDVMGLFLAD